MLERVLDRGDPPRVASVLEVLTASGFHDGALTGSLAIDLQLLSHGRPIERRPLNDIDVVVDTFASIPAGLSERFLVHHVHPDAPEGRILIQLIDPSHALRVDLFCAFGAALTRAVVLGGVPGALRVVALEDLAARTTSFVLGRLRRGRTIDVKFAPVLERLAGLGDPGALEIAWRDHRQENPEDWDDAHRLARRLVQEHPELAIHETYSRTVTACPQCRDSGPFRRAPSQRIVDILGYW